VRPPFGTFGVGHNPYSVSAVSGIEGTSRNNKRPCGVADALQVRKHAVEFQRDDSSNIFTKHPLRFGAINNAEHFRPERTVIARAASFPGEAVWLARKSPSDEVGSHALDVSDVAEIRHVGPVSFEDFAGIGFDFREADCFVSSGCRSQGEATDSRKEVEVSSTMMGNKALERMRVDALGEFGCWLVAHLSAIRSPSSSGSCGLSSRPTCRRWCDLSRWLAIAATPSLHRCSERDALQWER
jgi:hypothetical protein